ncbi:MAG: DUF2058 domain-containing protein [Pseudomarimonas sp.]
MRNPLQEQLLKAGLAKKSKIDQIAREQAKQRHSKAGSPANSEQADVERVSADRLRQQQVERDRALAAERNAQARLLEQRAQVRQIVEQTKLPIEGEIDYRFQCDGAIRSLRVTEPVRRQLSKGILAIARFDAGYAIIPRATVEKIEARDPTMIVVDHSRRSTASDADDEFYSQFKVPDDLIW